ALLRDGGEDFEVVRAVAAVVLGCGQQQDPEAAVSKAQRPDERGGGAAKAEFADLLALLRNEHAAHHTLIARHGMHAQKTQTRGAALPRTLRQIHGRGAVLAEKLRHQPLRGRIEEVDSAAAGLRHTHRAFDDELVHRLLLILAENGLAQLMQEA
ncbi:MAG: hypothetical protein ACK56I_25380, partial [bacterium]